MITSDYLCHPLLKTLVQIAANFSSNLRKGLHIKVLPCANEPVEPNFNLLSLLTYSTMKEMDTAPELRCKRQQISFV